MLEYVPSLADQEAFRWYTEDYPLQHGGPARDVVRETYARLENIGKQLFRSIFHHSPEAQRIWARASGDLSSLDIRIAGRPEYISTIPWELMYDAEGCGWIALHTASISRQLVDEIARSPRNHLRVLLVTSRPDAHADIPYRLISNLLMKIQIDFPGMFQVDLLRPPTFGAFVRAVDSAKQSGKPYSVVHFDGHGVWPLEPITAETAENLDLYRGAAVFEEPSAPNNRRLVDGTQMGHVLIKGEVQVLILNSCRSAHTQELIPSSLEGETEKEAERRERASRSFADEVAATGIPAVLAMRFKVLSSFASICTESLYSALLSGESFGRAVTVARKSLHTAVTGMNGADNFVNVWRGPYRFHMRPQTCGLLLRRRACPRP